MISPELEIGKLYLLPFKYSMFDVKNGQRYTGYTTNYKTHLPEGTPVVVLELYKSIVFGVTSTKYLTYRILCPDGNICYVEVTENAIKDFWKKVKI